ncbi:unnamed protein product [Arabis nemorensis]|uniref:Response regulatory domain-containing protein n=1 Tax=Arabis nemorensis TaxID=586526 RepID=A0A565BX79_9BRAS|nr:unnamed protein product [Arabis nemorensis]
MGIAAESQFHVLAVDDSLFDRKLIERLLQKSSLTTVDSGSKALEFLGLRESIDPNAVSSSPQESSALKNIPVVIMSSENVPARISRCLEEGAEEFLLKPVRLADLNKLKPHMMKTKLKNQKLEEIETPSKDENVTVAAGDEPEIVKSSAEIEFKIVAFQSETEPKQQHLQVVQQEEQTLSNNKRKSMEEGLSTERSRPRFDGITTAV